MYHNTEYDGLVRLLSGQPVPRQKRRQLMRAGLIDEQLALTDAGVKLLERWSPRSRWEAPPHQGCSLPPGWRNGHHRRHGSLTLLAVLSAIMGADAASGFTGGRRR